MNISISVRKHSSFLFVTILSTNVLSCCLLTLVDLLQSYNPLVLTNVVSCCQLTLVDLLLLLLLLPSNQITFKLFEKYLENDKH